MLTEFDDDDSRVRDADAIMPQLVFVSCYQRDAQVEYSVADWRRCWQLQVAGGQSIDDSVFPSLCLSSLSIQGPSGVSQGWCDDVLRGVIFSVREHESTVAKSGLSSRIFSGVV